jgi:hypothetical protein
MSPAITVIGRCCCTLLPFFSGLFLARRSFSSQIQVLQDEYRTIAARRSVKIGFTHYRFHIVLFAYTDRCTAKTYTRPLAAAVCVFRRSRRHYAKRCVGANCLPMEFSIRLKQWIFDLKCFVVLSSHPVEFSSISVKSRYCLQPQYTKLTASTPQTRDTSVALCKNVEVYTFTSGVFGGRPLEREDFHTMPNTLLRVSV